MSAEQLAQRSSADRAAATASLAAAEAGFAEQRGRVSELERSGAELSAQNTEVGRSLIADHRGRVSELERGWAELSSRRYTEAGSNPTCILPSPSPCTQWCNALPASSDSHSHLLPASTMQMSTRIDELQAWKEDAQSKLSEAMEMRGGYIILCSIKLIPATCIISIASLDPS